MLGKQVQVALEQTQFSIGEGGPRKPLYQGYLYGSNGQIGQKCVFVMGLFHPQKSLHGRVIAIVDKGPGEKLIIAPEQAVYYKPEICAALRTVGVQPNRLLCLYEKSCGVVVFRRDMGGLRFLIVKNKNGRHWGFPKGHMEAGETEEQTAVREVLEETGLHVTVCNGFRETSEYHPFGKIKKQVVFFTAQVEGQRVTIQQAEIDRFQWATYNQATKLFRYENDLRVLCAVMRWLGKK